MSKRRFCFVALAAATAFGPHAHGAEEGRLVPGDRPDARGVPFRPEVHRGRRPAGDIGRRRDDSPFLVDRHERPPADPRPRLAGELADLFPIPEVPPEENEVADGTGIEEGALPRREPAAGRRGHHDRGRPFVDRPALHPAPPASARLASSRRTPL